MLQSFVVKFTTENARNGWRPAGVGQGHFLTPTGRPPEHTAPPACHGQMAGPARVVGRAKVSFLLFTDTLGVITVLQEETAKCL